MNTPPKLALITTCMGRLEHVKKMSARLMEDPRIGHEIMWVLVDYACPDKTGEWVKKEYEERATVVTIEGVEPDPEETREHQFLFNKPLAQNSGAMKAIEEGAEFLAFLDADTLITKSFLDYVLSSMSLDNFLIVAPNLSKKDLTGFICVNYRHFMRSGGYDPAFSGWGAEDLEFRLKLYLKGELPFSEIPVALATSIAHPDLVRTKNYEEKDKDKSHDKNLNLLCANAFKWSGMHLLELYDTNRGPYIRRLLGIEPNNPRELL